MMGRRWTEEDYEHTTRQIERWIAEANRMWADDAVKIVPYAAR